MNKSEGGGLTAPAPPKWSLIERNVRRVTGEKNVASDDFGLAALMLASAVVGPGADKIARWSGWPRSRCRALGGRLRTNGIWVGRKIQTGGDWWGKDGGITFTLDVCMAKGWMERTSAPPEPEPKP